jgi:hypothetical protein
MRRTGQRLRLSRDRPELAGSVSSLDVSAGRPAATAPSASHPIATSLLDLQRLAGNRAVAAEVGSSRNGRVVVGVSKVELKTHPSSPPAGVRAIRESRGGGGLLGRTVASIESAPPLLRADAPIKSDKGWTCQALPTRAPEPYLEEWWPTAGRHEMYPHIYLDVSQDWEDRLKAGEDEHVADHTLGWQLTWAIVSQAVAELAKAPGPARPTEEAARSDLWERFRAALPADLRPGGDAATDEAQAAKWGLEPTTSLFRRLFQGTKARDQRGWHTTTSELDSQEGPDGRDEIRHVAGTTRIGEVSSADLLAELRGRPGH